MRIVHFTLIVVALGFPTTAQERAAAEVRPALPGGVGILDRANNATNDAVHGLPNRVVHRASGITLVLIPAGEFVMGSPTNENDRSNSETQHRRFIRKPFYLAETEVTVKQFHKFVEVTSYKTDAERGVDEGNGHGVGSFATVDDGERTWDACANWKTPFPLLKDVIIGPNHPVHHMSWNDAKAFCAHFKLRLPTEAEWEYAARAGSKERYPWGPGEDGGAGYANVGDLSKRRRFSSTNVNFPFDDGHALIAPVKSYQPNAWGLYDMIGNLEEWCEDVYMKSHNVADQSAVKGPAEAGRVLKGGAWIGNQGTSRVAARISMRASSRRDFQGFRVALDAE